MQLRDDLKSDFDSLLPGQDSASRAGASRRTALKAALGVGYAAAAMPIVAQTAIQTSADGLVAGPVSFEVNGFKVPAYRAAPAGKTGLPVVLLVHEIWGVHQYIADTARRLAHAGYLALAPDLFARQGDASGYTETGRLLADLVSKVPDAQVIADLDGARRWAAGNGGDMARVGITGFCWGGRITWLYAAHAPVKAGVAWYGRLAGASTDLTPRHPIDMASQMKAPTLGLYGANDAGIALDTVDKMKVGLAQGGSASRESQFVVYPDAGHAFHADYRPTYRAGPAEDGWKRMLAWLKSHGVA